MKRTLLRMSLAAFLVAVTFLAVMLWTGKYESDPDHRARYKIESAQLERDRSYVWLEIHLRKNGDMNHDMLQPVVLVTADGTQHEPADTTFAGTPEKGFSDIWFKFWLEITDLQGEIDLRMNGGELRVKTNKGAPSNDKSGKSVIKSADWEKTWPGF